MKSKTLPCTSKDKHSEPCCCLLKCVSTSQMQVRPLGVGVASARSCGMDAVHSSHQGILLDANFWLKFSKAGAWSLARSRHLLKCSITNACAEEQTPKNSFVAPPFRNRCACRAQLFATEIHSGPIRNHPWTGISSCSAPKKTTRMVDRMFVAAISLPGAMQRCNLGWRDRPSLSDSLIPWEKTCELWMGHVVPTHLIPTIQTESRGKHWTLNRRPIWFRHSESWECQLKFGTSNFHPFWPWEPSTSYH